MNAFIITSSVAIFILLVLYYINKDNLPQFPQKYTSLEMRSDQDAPRYKYGLGYTNPKRLTKN